MATTETKSAAPPEAGPRQDDDDARSIAPVEGEVNWAKLRQEALDSGMTPQEIAVVDLQNECRAAAPRNGHHTPIDIEMEIKAVGLGLAPAQHMERLVELRDWYSDGMPEMSGWLKQRAEIAEQPAAPDLQEEAEADESAVEQAVELAGAVAAEGWQPVAKLAAVFAGDPQKATRRGNLLVAKYGHLQQQLADVEIFAEQELARIEQYRDRQRAQIERDMTRVEMALLVYVTDWYPAKQRQVELPAGIIKRRKVPAQIVLAPNDKLLDFIHTLPLEVADGVTKMVETVQRAELKKRLTKTEDGQVLLDGELLTRTVTGEDGEPTEELLAWVEEKPEKFTVEPAARRPAEGDAVVPTKHARERFEERGCELYEGEDPEERLAALAEDARGMCRRAGVQDIDFMGLVWCFAVDRGTWTLKTVKPGTGTPQKEESE